MKRKPVLRVIAFIVCVLTASAGLWAGILTLHEWDELWTDGGYYSSGDFYENCYAMGERVEELARLLMEKESGEKLTYSQEERMEALERSLSASNTNYRYELRLEQSGKLVSSNMGSELMDDTVGGIQLTVFPIREHEEYHYQDETVWAEYPVAGSDEVTECVLLRVWTGEEYLEFRADEARVSGYNQYGWYSDGEQWVDYAMGKDSRVQTVEYALRYGAALDLSRCEDVFWTGAQNYAYWHSVLPQVAVGAIVSFVVSLVLMVRLCVVAGHREGVEGIYVSWADRIPLEVYVLAAIGGVSLVFGLGDAIVRGIDSLFQPERFLALVGVTSIGTASVLALMLTFAVRVKAHRVLEGLFTWRVCRWSWRQVCRGVRAFGGAVKSVVRTLSMDVRLGIAFLVYLGINAFLAGGFYLTAYSRGFFLVGLVLFNGGAFWLGCRWIEQWRRIREDTSRVLGGDTAVQIDTKKMYPDLRQHAEQLNDLGASINRAVDERLKSEHFKAELITNVSHDLKTPLTSIINYVDLLKKTDIRDPKAQEYLEVLDRKSQRLKKLTEDLVEASKASTGNVTVNAARLDLVEITQQAAAEYADRLTGQRLTLITKMADHPVYVSADGRHLWRILDNLLGNCVKYALEGTRVYLDVVEWDGKGLISVKNISREELNMTPEELTERFVRGDESRTTEGSGLGLSIARSLTEVQGGTFRVTTDGDLFKATVYFPTVLALEGSNPPAA